jgi:hypothetical protein
MTTAKLEGVYANVTPLRTNDRFSIDVEACVAHVRWLAATDVKGWSGSGRTGKDRRSPRARSGRSWTYLLPAQTGRGNVLTGGGAMSEATTIRRLSDVVYQPLVADQRGIDTPAA